MNRYFPYPKVAPAMNAVIAMLLAGACVLLLSITGEVGILWVAIFAAAIFGTVLVVYVSPLLTDHIVAGGKLRIRYGWIFKADVPLADIADAKALVSGEKARGSLDLTTEKTRRVLVTLRARRRFAHALLRSYDRIALSVEDVPRFLEAIGGLGE